MIIDKKEDGSLSSKLLRDFPNIPIIYWEFDSKTLQRFNEGMNGETATARARENDPYPLKTRKTEKFLSFMINKELRDFLEELRLHFWTKGLPEKFILNKKVSRVSHGANLVGLVYSEGLRTMWFQVEPKQHINKDSEDQKNPFNSLFIITKGKIDAIIGGGKILLEEGNSYLIPAEVAHEFWNSSNTPSEGVLIMYGKGA